MDHMQGWEGRTEVESWLREVGTYYAGSLADIDWQKGAMGLIDCQMNEDPVPLRRIQGLVCAAIQLSASFVCNTTFSLETLSELTNHAFSAKCIRNHVHGLLYSMGGKVSVSSLHNMYYLAKGNSAVYAATIDDGSNAADVVVKLFRRSVPSQGMLKQLLATSVLEHDNISKLIGVVAAREGYGLVSPLYKHTFDDFCKHGPDGGAQLKAVLQLLNAMAYSHAEEVVHLDLKTDNIMFDDGFNLIVNDWDSSQKIGIDACTSFPIVTANFRAPEACMEEQGCSLLALDVWSIGCIIIAIANGGRPPWPGVIDIVAWVDDGGEPARIPGIMAVKHAMGSEVARAAQAMLRVVASERPSVADVLSMVSNL